MKDASILTDGSNKGKEHPSPGPKEKRKTGKEELNPKEEPERKTCSEDGLILSVLANYLT